MFKAILRGVVAAGAVAAVVLAAPPVRGEDFRVDNKVFGPGEEKPQSQGTTIFYDGIVYDFLEQPAEVIVFDKAAEQFTLLDTGRRVWAQLSAKEILAFAGQIKQRAAGHTDPLIRFMAEPAFQEQFDEKSGELTLVGTWMTYGAKLDTGQTAGVANQYREFSDWYARLNTVLAGAHLPFARLLLNEAIAKRMGVPREVELTLKRSQTKRITVRSRHELFAQLNAADIARVTDARMAMRTFKQLGFEQYRKGR